MLYILVGPDDFSLQEKLAGIKSGLGAGELLEANTTVLEGDRLTSSQLEDVCCVAPFLAPKRLVVVRGLLARFGGSRGGDRRRKRSSGAGKSGEWQSILRSIKTMPDTTVLVLIDDKIDSDSPLFRELAPLASVNSFPLLTGSGLKSWIRSRVKGGGGSISQQAVSLLAGIIGGDLSAIAQEIEKLLIYASGRAIEEDDVMLLVSYSREANVFAMVDAILEHRASDAMLLLHSLLSEGASPPYLMTMIARQIRLVVLAGELMSEGAPSTEVGKQLGLSGYALQKTLKQARVYPAEQLEFAYGKLLEADLAFKTGKWQAIRAEKWRDEFSLDLFVSELCYGQAS